MVSPEFSGFSGGNHVQIILFNKPFNVLCQFSEPGRRLTLADYISIPGVYAADRLDYDSEGLLILTDTGRIQQRIARPCDDMARTYWVQVEGVPTPAAIQQLSRGVQLEDGLTVPASVAQIKPPPVWPRTPPVQERRHVPTSWLAITLAEERNRLIRRMTAAVGLPTLRLIRQAVGPWQLNKLQPGDWKVTSIPAGWL
jgi:23S rRNA pseudouridine2457 synthase